MGGLDKSIFSPLLFIAGIVMFFASLHLIRGIGQWHGRFAKHVLVEVGGRLTLRQAQGPDAG